jgi:hypothetical protein
MVSFKKHGARNAACGLYGPDNPPPPPPGLPPSRQERKQEPKQDNGKGAESFPPQDFLSAKGPGRAFLHRKLNSRQRKHFLNQQVDPVMPQGRGRSSSPPRRESQNSREGYRERSPVRIYGHRSQVDNETSRRGPLRDARHITPDQIMDNTRGRLSPIRAPGEADFYQTDRADWRFKKLTDGPDECPKHAWRDKGGQGGGKGQARRERSKSSTATVMTGMKHSIG